MEYNLESKKLELTIIISTHDVEHWLSENGIKENELENKLNDSIIKNKIGNTILKGFVVTSKDSQVRFHIIGYEVKDNGVTEFYFKSTPIEIQKPLLVKYDLLMDSFPNQQNKLTFIYQSKKQTFAYISSEREHYIDFN